MHASANQPPDFHYNVSDSRQKLIVSVGLCENGDMMGPFFFDGNVFAQSYLNLLNDEVIPLMTVLLQNQFCQNWFQRLWSSHDGAPCQWLLAVLAKLNQLFGERILSLYNKTEWLPRSPDLIPVIFYLLGYLKDQVFRTPPESLNVVW